VVRAIEARAVSRAGAPVERVRSDAENGLLTEGRALRILITNDDGIGAPALPVLQVDLLGTATRSRSPHRSRHTAVAAPRSARSRTGKSSPSRKSRLRARRGSLRSPSTDLRPSSSSRRCRHFWRAT
jgi:hypothetical protein